MMLARPEERIERALARLRNDADFQEVVTWLEHSLAELDRAVRVTLPAELLRQQQGAGQVVAEFLAHAKGKATRNPFSAIPARAAP